MELTPEERVSLIDAIAKALAEKLYQQIVDHQIYVGHAWTSWNAGLARLVADKLARLSGAARNGVVP